MSASADPENAALPDLPEHVEPEQLRELDDSGIGTVEAELREAERVIVAAMSPFERQLREVRARRAEVATERRRRERLIQVAQRAAVREQAKSGAMPSLAEALATAGAFPDDTQLSAIRAFLSTGGEVGFGFPTRPGPIAFTDGRQQRQARTWAEARALYSDGWEPGTPGVAGVRVHLAGSRVERVVAAEEVVIDVAPATSP